MKLIRRFLPCLLIIIIAVSVCLSGCAEKESQVIIYSNADDEAVEAMKAALDNNGFTGKYLFQTFGTSELGGKLLAEGKNIEADVVTMSSYYIDSAQQQNNMFIDLTFPRETIASFPSYAAPITAQEGALILNTEMLAENNLKAPTSIQDLSKPEYAGMISVTDIESSSTAWLLIQALINEYAEEEAKNILTKIYENAGPHIESSGSAPLKKVRAGEVAIGFGLRHQAVADKLRGLPIDFVDPTEGNFSLTESIAVVNRDGKENPIAMEMADCIINKGRNELIKTYPLSLYKGETADSENISGNPKTFQEPLTVELLEKHKNISNACK